MLSEIDQTEKGPRTVRSHLHMESKTTTTSQNKNQIHRNREMVVGEGVKRFKLSVLK